MFLTIIVQTVKDHAKGCLIIAALLFVWMLYMVIVYPSVANTDMSEMMNSPAIQAMYGAGIVMSSFEGYMTTKAMLLFGLLFGGYIAWLAASFLSGEVEHKTIDLLLSLPVKRENLVLARYLSLLPVIGVLLSMGLAGIYAASDGKHLSLSPVVWLGDALPGPVRAGLRRHLCWFRRC